MKRQTKPYFKKSHRAFYVNLNGKPIRLASEAEGHEKAMEAYFRVMAGRLPPSDDLTVAVLMHRFIASHEHSPPGTRRFYTRPCRSFLDYIGAALRVSEAAPYHVETWLRECHAFKRLPSGKRSDQPTSSTYRHNLVRAVKSAFCWGEAQGYIATNPVRRVKVPPQVPRGDEAYLEPDQWAKVVACDDPNLLDLLDVLTVLYETGCRPQELRRVESRHYDRAARTWDFVVEESKGKRDRRTVLLSDPAFEICQRLALKHPEGPIFRDRRGKPWTATALDRECEKLSKLVGFHLTPYMVRHTFATRKILAGVDLISIAALMGHRNLTSLSRVYAHVMRRQDHLRAALKQERVTPQAALPQAVLPQAVLPQAVLPVSLPS